MGWVTSRRIAIIVRELLLDTDEKGDISIISHIIFKRVIFIFLGKYVDLIFFQSYVYINLMTTIVRVHAYIITLRFRFLLKIRCS